VSAARSGDRPRRLRREALTFAGVLLEELDRGESHPALRGRLARRALTLQEALTLAEAGLDTEERLLDAEAALLTLRVQMRLAYDLGVLDEDPWLALAEQCELVGGLLGAWIDEEARVH